MEGLVAATVPIFGTLITAVVTWGLAELSRYIRSKTKSAHVDKALVEIQALTDSAVRNLQVSFERAAADGKLTKEEAVAIKNDAVERVKVNLPAATTKALGWGTDALTEYIGGQVESRVHRVKSERKFEKTTP